MGSARAGMAIVVELRPASQSVSAVSSLLREIQAALREAARAVPNTARLFDGDQSPVLTVQFAGSADRVSLAFDFVNPTTRASLTGVSEAAAKGFMSALEEELKRRPQRTLWGQPAVIARHRAGDGDRDPLSERASAILSELGRVTAAFVAGAGRRIRVEGETAEIF